MTITTTGDGTDVRVVSQRIESLLGQLAEQADPRARQTAEDLVSLLMQFYGAGLERMLEIVTGDGRQAPADAGELLDRFADDDLVASLLILHDLHPVPLEVRVQRALDQVRPYLGSHGGGVEVVSIEGDTVRVHMGGSCEGCPSSQVTLNYALEKAILEAAPEIARVEAVETDAPLPALIQLQPRGATDGPMPAHANGNGHDGHRHQPAVPAGPVEWQSLDRAPARPGEIRLERVAGVDLVLCRTDEHVYAYRPACPSCGTGLDQGRLEGTILTCASCGHTYDLKLAGRSADGAAQFLDPLPLVVEGAAVRIAVPALVQA